MMGPRMKQLMPSFEGRRARVEATVVVMALVVLVCIAYSVAVALPQSAGQPGPPKLRPVSSSPASLNPAPAIPPAVVQQQQAVVKQYCVPCHNGTAKIGGLALDHADLTQIPEQAEIWEKVEKKLRSGMMPPVGMPQPGPAKADELASLLESGLDQAAAAKPNPGPWVVRRLSHTEYGNAVRDLLALDLDTT